MSRGGSLMGKRATVTQVVHTAKNKDGFIEDAFWGPVGKLQPGVHTILRTRMRGCLGVTSC